MFLWSELLLITFIISGITLKLADFYGEIGNNILQYFFAVASALSFGLLIFNDSYTSSIILGIIVGVTLSRKVNRPNLVLGLILTLLIAGILGFSLGFSLPIPWLLIIVSLFSFIDEFCHDKFSANREYFTLFFRFRPLLKLAMLLLAISSLVETIYALGFLSFDLAYDVTSWLLTRGKPKAALN